MRPLRFAAADGWQHLVLSLLLLLHTGRSEASPEHALSAAWLRLMHYHGSEGAWRNAFDSRQFFLSPIGQTSPASELKAQIDAFKQDTILIQGQSWDPICAYPARAQWIRENLDPVLPARPCPELEEWIRKLQFRSLSMVFSSAYAGNSASMFGHNLLKINLLQPAALGQSGDGLELLDYGMGFLAQSDPSDGLMYGPKGVFGGYPGIFTLQPYYQLVNTYAYAENRDLWELEIPLSDTEKDLFLNHMWELLHHASTPYYFTHANCSSMLVALLDVLKPEWKLLEDFEGFILPAVVMQKIAQRIEPKKVAFRPSQRRLLQAQLQTLKPSQRVLLSSLADGHAGPQEIGDRAVLDAALLKLSLDKSTRTLAEQASLRDDEAQLLWARSRLRVSSPEPLPLRPSNNPIYGHSPQKFSLGVSSRPSELKASTGFRWRYGWHDLLDPLRGFDPYYQLNYLDVRAQKLPESDEHQLSATLAEVWSLSAFSWNDPMKSWILRGGTEHNRIDGKVEVRTQIEGAVGVSLEFKRDRSLVALLPSLKLGLAHIPLARGFYEVGAKLMWLQRWSDRWQSLLTLQPAWQDLRDEKSRSELAAFELRLNLLTAQQLSFEVSRKSQSQTQVQLAWSHFL